jgi:hypothetical protein
VDLKESLSHGKPQKGKVQDGNIKISDSNWKPRRFNRIVNQPMSNDADRWAGLPA